MGNVIMATVKARSLKMMFLQGDHFVLAIESYFENMLPDMKGLERQTKAQQGRCLTWAPV